MKRRDFLRAVVGGTVAALLGVQARQLQGGIRAGSRIGKTGRNWVIRWPDVDAELLMERLKQTAAWPQRAAVGVGMAWTPLARVEWLERALQGTEQ